MAEADEARYKAVQAAEDIAKHAEALADSRSVEARRREEAADERAARLEQEADERAAKRCQEATCRSEALQQEAKERGLRMQKAAADRLEWYLDELATRILASEKEWSTTQTRVQAEHWHANRRAAAERELATHVQTLGEQCEKVAFATEAAAQEAASKVRAAHREACKQHKSEAAGALEEFGGLQDLVDRLRGSSLYRG